MQASLASEALWYLSRNGHEFGPVPESEFRRMHQAHRIAPTDYVWSEELGDWKLAGDILPPPGPPAHLASSQSPTQRSQMLAAAPRPLPARATARSAPARQPERHAVTQTIVETGSFKLSTILFIIAGLIVPLWPVSLPLCWYLAYRSYKKPATQTVRIIQQAH